MQQIIYDGSKDSTCKNIITISKDPCYLQLSNNTAEQPTRLLGCSPVKDITNFDYYVLVNFESVGILNNWYRVLNKKTAKTYGIAIYGQIKYIYYNNCVYIWHRNFDVYQLTIFEANNHHASYRIYRDNVFDDFETTMLVKFRSNCDLRLIESSTKIYDSLTLLPDHFNQDGHLVLYHRVKPLVFRGGFEDISIVV